MTPPTPDARRPRLRLRRNPAWLLGGLTAVCLGGLSSAYLFTSATDADDVLRANRTIHRGEVLAPADLSVVSVGAGADVGTVPGARLGEVVGQAAVTDIPAGSLLVSGSLGGAGLPPGAARVGVRLEAGRHPTGLLPGSTVLVVALPEQAAGSTPDAVLPASVPATLVGAPAVQPDGSVVADLTLAADQAESVARLASAGRVSLVERGTR